MKSDNWVRRGSLGPESEGTSCAKIRCVRSVSSAVWSRQQKSARGASARTFDGTRDDGPTPRADAGCPRARAHPGATRWACEASAQPRRWLNESVRRCCEELCPKSFRLVLVTHKLTFERQGHHAGSLRQPFKCGGCRATHREYIVDNRFAIFENPPMRDLLVT